MKQERAVVVALSYLIGFTTAFIGFGLEVSPEPIASYQPNFAAIKQQASLVESQNVTLFTEAWFDNRADGLYLVSETGERIVSVASGVNPDLEDVAHADIVAAGVSPNNRFGYFCAVPVSSEGDCINYIYDRGSHTVRTVKLHGEQFTSSSETLRATWSSDDYLQINQYVSSSNAEPWLME